ncbi:MAG: putative ATP-dependent RNA helicase DHR1 [Trizodia sp. TS-e1964]|nr:MAG: putative ATP-dependent RNA helicase DHR1 [Trizodia sp. TS-e1964]
MPKFIPRQRKHKVLRRQGHINNNGPSSFHEIQPVSKSEKDENRQQLLGALQPDQSKISSKKRKRQEKYIDKKLKKEENLNLIKELSNAKIDTSLLKSSRNIGSGKESKRERLSRALREENAGIDIDGHNKEILYEHWNSPTDLNQIEESGQLDLSFVPQAGFDGPPPLFGSGLKLNLDDVAQKVGSKRDDAAIILEELPWDGFSSISDDDRMSWNGTSEDNSSTEDPKDPRESLGSNVDHVEMSALDSERSSAFQAWVTRSRNSARGISSDRSMVPVYDTSIYEKFVPRPIEQDDLPTELQFPKTSSATLRKAFPVSIERPPEIQLARLGLPVVAEEQKIMEAINNHSVVIICGETGSGKTTQIPQFLFEAGFGSPNSTTPGMIGITQPRRVAAVSMAKRVGEELGKDKSKVSYQIRYESSKNLATAMKFMTDGILLREIAVDFTLSKYSAIIIDEAHERTLNTDILIGMMSRIVKVREELSGEDSAIQPLKLIIMSATLRISDFTKNDKLFSIPPPIIQAEGKQHAVVVHFARRTSRSYVEEAFQKISKGHKKLPPGGFLVFLTGQNEILELSRLLRGDSGEASTANAPIVKLSPQEAPLDIEDIDLEWPQDFEVAKEDSSGKSSEDSDNEEFESKEPPADLSMYILPLYSKMETKEQLRVFQEPPDGTRLIILATNVAETSLTIPGIRYVFDCGRAKERKYDEITGVQSYDIGWISKASASQRTGRAGRTGPGHCYRLYSSAVFERDFEEFSRPEITRMPIEGKYSNTFLKFELIDAGVVLQLKSMKIPHIEDFPFPTPPSIESLQKAENLLSNLKALSDGKINDLGALMSAFPLSPRFSRMLLIRDQSGSMPYVIALVAALSVQEIFIPKSLATPLSNGARYEKAHHNFSKLDNTSDALKLLVALIEYTDSHQTEEFCQRNFIHSKALWETDQLRRQLCKIMASPYKKLDLPSPKQVQLLKQVVALGFVDKIAIRADLAPNPADIPKRILEVPYQTREGITAYIHPSSVLARKFAPPYIVYSHLQTASKVRMHALTTLTEQQLANVANGTTLLSYSKPLKINPLPSGPSGERRECIVVPNYNGWPLPCGTKKVVQRRIQGQWEDEL